MMEQKDSFNAVQKALRVLMAFQGDRPTWGVRELGSHLGFSPATVQRLLRTLKEYAFVDQDPDTRQYRLGNVYFHFLHVLQGTYPVTRVAMPFMKDLVALTQETVHLNLIDGIERICVDSIESPQYLRGSMPIGEKSPLYAGASAKCLLAFSEPEFVDEYLKRASLVPMTHRTLASRESIMEELERIRAGGYAQSLGERTPGLASISAPVFDHTGGLLAAISFAIPELRYQDQTHREFCLRVLLDAASGISKAMGYRGPYPMHLKREDFYDTECQTTPQ